LSEYTRTQEDENNERVLEAMPKFNVAITKKVKKNDQLNTGDGKFDLNLQEIGEMQKEITRRLTK